jgi:hypothetical protein
MATAGEWRGQPRRAWLPVVRGMLLAIPIVAVFALLLSSADLMFAGLLRQLIPVDFMAFVQRLLGHGTVILLVGFCLLGGLAYTMWREERPDQVVPVSPSVSPIIGLTESAVMLNAVNLLFAAFVLIQVPYLFGGQLNIDLGRVTYAEYARRGFGELVATSVLVLGMLLALGALTRRASARDDVIFKVSCTITVGLTMVMLVSAFKRLLLYEVAYGFTEMRVYPHVFMIWLALLLGWFLVTVWFRPGRFAIGLLVACIGFVATLNVINVDDFIVRQNVQRSEQLGAAAFATPNAYRGADERIDPEYLTRLSDDAIPALVETAGRLDYGARAPIDAYLAERYDWLTQTEDRPGWQASHLGRRRAQDALLAWRDEAR